MRLAVQILIVIMLGLAVLSLLGTQIGAVELVLLMLVLVAAIATLVLRHRRSRTRPAA